MSLISAIAIIRLRCEVVEALLWKCATYCRYLKLYRWWVQGVRTFPWQPGSQCTHLTMIPKNWEAVALLPGGRKFCKRTQKWLQKNLLKLYFSFFQGQFGQKLNFLCCEIGRIFPVYCWIFLKLVGKPLGETWQQWLVVVRVHGVRTPPLAPRLTVYTHSNDDLEVVMVCCEILEA